MFVWWRDIVREGTFEGAHTKKVQAGLRLGVILFIVSEVMFFFSFFWTFFHSSLAPAIEIGQSWPPLEISVLSPWGIPLLNTVILLTSGATITVCHHGIVWGAKKISVQYLGLTIGLAFFFILFQAFEYLNAPFTISDSVYGSIFFMTTGFHGFHVAIGTIYLIVCYFRLSADHFTRTHHIGFLGAAWYWHFVDVVWLFLFIIVYWFCVSSSIEEGFFPALLDQIHFWIPLLMVADFFLLIVSLLGTYFILLRDRQVKEFMKELFLVWKSVPIFNKLPLLAFTVLAGVPNRFLIHNSIGSFGTFVITFSVLLLGVFVMPLFHLLIIAYISLLVVNLLFAFSYEKSSRFRDAFHVRLFGVQDHYFAPLYIFFFFGNRHTSGL